MPRLYVKVVGKPYSEDVGLNSSTPYRRGDSYDLLLPIVIKFPTLFTYKK